MKTKEKSDKQFLKEYADKTLHAEMRMKRAALKLRRDFPDLKGRLKSQRKQELFIECMAWAERREEEDRIKEPFEKSSTFSF